MANRYWVGKSINGNWFSTSNWSSTSNGSGGASVPTSVDDVFFDQYSFNADGQGVTTVDGTAAYCRSMTWTGATNTPKFNFAYLYIYGSLTFIAQMKFSSPVNNTCAVYFSATSGSYTLNIPTSFKWTSPDTFFRGWVYIQGSGTTTYNLAADMYCYDLEVYNGIFNTNNYNISTAGYLSFRDYTQGYSIPTPYATMINLGTSTVLGSTVTIDGTDKISLTADQATISVVTLYAGAGGNSFGTLTFPATGVYGTIGGVFSVGSLDIPSNANRINFDTGTSITLSNLNATGTSGHQIILKPTTTGQTWTLSSPSGVKTCNYITLTGSQATGGAIWNAGPNSIDGGSNTGWYFPRDNALFFGAAF